MQNSVVFKSSRDDAAFTLPGPKSGSLGDGPIVCFTAAGGEINFLRFSAQAMGNALTGIFQQTAGFLAFAIEAGRIALSSGKSGQQGR